MMTTPVPLMLPHDVIEPAPIGWWPLAPGWWLLMILVAVASTLLIVWWRRRHRALAPLRQALQEHAEIQRQWQQHRDHRAATAALSALLKRTARWRYPADDTAALSGAQWQAFLLRTGNGAFTDASAALLGQFYQSPQLDTDAPPFEPCLRWLQQQRHLRQQRQQQHKNQATAKQVPHA